MPSIRASMATYLERRMGRIFLLGIISGFPWVLIGSSLSLWLQEDGLSRTAIGWAGLIFGVYAFNFLWAPLIDRIRIPWLSPRLGHRRAWIVTLQAVILLCLVAWSAIEPSVNLAGVIAIGLVIAVASATQDITIDALRIEQIGTEESETMAAGAAIAVVGWWTGYKLGGVVALETAAGLQGAGIENYWQVTFLVLGVVVILCNIGLMFVREPAPEARIAAQAADEELVAGRVATAGQLGRAGAWLASTVVGPLMSFFRRNGFAIAAAVLGFVFLFKIGEAFMGRMSLVFYKEIGFSKSDIALYSKGLGWVTTVVFTVLGGLCAIRIGLVRAMFVAGIAMALTNLMFAALAWTGKSEGLFAAAVVMDDLTSAFATVTFVAFISMLVDRTYTATQYALLASIGTAGRTLFAASSGTLVDYLGGDWGTFFVITTLMVMPSLLCLWAIRGKLRGMLTGARVRLLGKDVEAASSAAT
ncbi:MAG: MFS transporter [Gammaproteobacteria bacterium]|nr:MFS transporter [Gammaproteobacteria bacterium]